MSLRESVYNTLVAGSPPMAVYWQVLKLGTDVPAVVFLIIFRQPEEGLSGEDCYLLHAHVQVDCYALSQRTADEMAGDVRRLMLDADDFAAKTVGGFDDYEDDTRRYRSTQEFSVWLST